MSAQILRPSLVRYRRFLRPIRFPLKMYSSSSSASFSDVVAAKLLVGLTYQLLLAMVALGIKGGYTGEVPLLLLFVLLGSCFSVSLGLLVGSIFQTTTATGAFSGMISFIYILPIFFVGPFAQLLGSNPFTQLIKVLPTFKKF
jgi:ABC-2 type transport system permease protein